MSAALAQAPTLVLRRPRAKGVAHLVLRVAPGRGQVAREALRMFERNALPGCFGSHAPDATQPQATYAFTWRGLQALGVPRPYLRTFSRLAPAFAEGAPLRGGRLGDSGASSPSHWRSGFALDAAHVLLTLHGPPQTVEQWASDLQQCAGEYDALVCVDLTLGQRLGHPQGAQGEWVHFGFRDGLTDHAIEDVPESGPPLPVLRWHRAGEFLLGHENDAGFNRFALESAPALVRSFFHHGSFVAYRPMRQDVQAFEHFVDAAWASLRAQTARTDVPREWVKAKLAGRWPGGEALRPGQQRPTPGDFDLRDFAGDDEGVGCPFASHVRRMRPRGADAHDRERPLLRRSMPFGDAVWEAAEQGAAAIPPGDRGLLGLFFCASLEDQFEHLLGQWANRRPLGVADTSRAKDPLIGEHEDPRAGMQIPLGRGRVATLHGWQAWTRTLGTLYAWCPGRDGLGLLLAGEYTRPEDEGPWL